MLSILPSIDFDRSIARSLDRSTDPSTPHRAPRKGTLTCANVIGSAPVGCESWCSPQPEGSSRTTDRDPAATPGRPLLDKDEVTGSTPESKGVTTGDPEDGNRVGTDVRTFLIADVRGYTKYTQEHGDEAAASLASTFAELVREVVEARQGHLLELRGDEALVVFNSARQALRAAVDLQARFALAGLPRGVGIGLDSGEAIPVGSGYRGAALNLAARLCAQAGPGQILASETVIRLAARVAGVAYVDPQTLRLKGFDEPVRAFEVVPEERVRRGGAAGFVRRARRLASRPAGLTATAAFVAVAVLLVVLLPRAFGGKPPVSSPAPSAAPVRGNKLVRIDAATSRVVAEIPVGTSPTGVTTGAGSVWVADSAGTVSRIDPVTNKVIVAIPVGKEPEAIGFDGTHIWVADRIGTAMYELDPGSNRVVAKVALDTRPVSVAFAGSRVFVAGSSPSGTGEAPVIGIDEATHETTEIARLATLAGDATGCLLVAGMEGAVWATNREGRVVKLEPTTGREIGTVQLDDLSHAIVAGPEGLWVLASGFPGRVRLLDSSSLRTIATIPVGSTAVGFSSGQCIRARPAMAEADRLLWVTNLSDGTLSKVDVSALRGVGTVAIGRTPTGVAADFGSVWVTVCSQATCETSIGG